MILMMRTGSYFKINGDSVQGYNKTFQKLYTEAKFLAKKQD